MATNELIFNNLEIALTGFIEDFARTYKEYLIRDGKKASGNLIQSIRPISIQVNSSKISADISLANYWKYVEYGRKPGKFPPVNKILNWIKIKPILPRPMNGLKPPTEEQLAFLISRKISRDGIKAGNQFTDALEMTWNRWEQTISDAISKDLQAAVDLVKI